MNPSNVADQVGLGLAAVVMLVAGIDLGIAFLMGAAHEAASERDG